MKLGIPQILPHVRQQHLHFLGIPFQQLGEQPEGEALETLLHLDQIPRADCFLQYASDVSNLPLLHISPQYPQNDRKQAKGSKQKTHQMLILRPRPNRQPKPLRHHALKARLPHPPLQPDPRLRIPPEIPTRLQQRAGPFADREVFPEGAVFGVVAEVEVLELGPGAGCEGGEDVGDEPWPGGDGGGHVAGVDEVEWIGPGPGGFAVVDFEFDVGGDPGKGGRE